MIKDIFKLKKQGWHSRLMKLTWGWTYEDFSHMCPYFWLSIVNVVIFPFVFTIKIILWRLLILGLFYNLFCMSIITFFEYIANYADRKYMEWEEEQRLRLRSIPTEELAILVDTENLMSAKWKKFYDDLSRNANFIHDRWHHQDDYLKFYRAMQDTLQQYRIKQLQRNDQLALSPFMIKVRTADPTNPVVLTEEQIAKMKRIEERQKHREEVRERRKKRREQRRKERERRRVEKEEARYKREAAARAIACQKAKIKAERFLATKEARMRRKQDIVRVLKAIKPIATFIVYALGACVGAIAIYFIYRLLSLFGNVPHTTYTYIGNIMKWVLIGVALISLIVLFIKYIVLNIPFGRFFTWVGRGIRKVDIGVKINIDRPAVDLTPISEFFSAIGDGFSFIWHRIIVPGAKAIVWPFVKAAKGIYNAVCFLRQMIKENCPAIEWVD
jgi:hypothetical protein